MIVCHSRKFVFVAVPKTGSQSVRQALQPCLATTDWEQCCLLYRRSFPVPELSAIEHGHITCRQLRPFLPAPFWDSYLKFAFVRNPFDRLRSLARFWQGPGPPLGIDGFKRMLTSPEIYGHILMRPQTEFLCDADGKLMIDHVGRYDSLATDFAAVCGALGFSTVSLPLLNVSPRAAHVPFDSELTEMVSNFYRSDFARFGFPAEEPECDPASQAGK